MKIFITGGFGFVGKYLMERLKDHSVLPCTDDIREIEQLRNTLDHFRPDRIYHLAAQAYVPESFTNPQRAFEVNTIGTLNLLEAVRQLGLRPKILLAGTSEEYGDGDVSEDSCLQPRSPYAISKVAMDQLGHLYHDAYGLHVVTTRAFNHTGPGRGEMYAESAWAKRIVEIENGTQHILEHGNLETVRNLTDVRDMVRAYKLAIELSPDHYNICSPYNWHMKDVLETLTSLAKVNIISRSNPALQRPADFSFKEPDCKKFQDLTGWKPKVAPQDTLKDLLEDWRRRL